jgi:hypothetical protein
VLLSFLLARFSSGRDNAIVESVFSSLDSFCLVAMAYVWYGSRSVAWMAMNAVFDLVLLTFHLVTRRKGGGAVRGWGWRREGEVATDLIFTRALHGGIEPVRS